VVTAAHLYVNDDWAASFSSTPVDLYLTCLPVNNGWNSTDLNWGNKPCEISKQDERTSYETSFRHSQPWHAQLQHPETQPSSRPQTTCRHSPSSCVRRMRATTPNGSSFASRGGCHHLDRLHAPARLRQRHRQTRPSPRRRWTNGTTFTTSHTPDPENHGRGTPTARNVQTVYQVWQGSASSPTTLMRPGHRTVVRLRDQRRAVDRQLQPARWRLRMARVPRPTRSPPAIPRGCGPAGPDGTCSPSTPASPGAPGRAVGAVPVQPVRRRFRHSRHVSASPTTRADNVKGLHDLPRR